MKCAYHPAEESVQICAACRRYLCAACSHLIKGLAYCQDCLVQGARLAQLAGEAAGGIPTPRRAAFLSLIPGIGAVYNRQYRKALVHVAVWGALATLSHRGPDFFHLALLSFWVFTMIDSYRSAQEILKRRVESPSAAEPLQGVHPLFWGALLILSGLLFLLQNLRLFSFDAVERFWPLGLVVVGLYLVYDHYRKAAGGVQSTAPGGANPSVGDDASVPSRK